MFLSKRHNLDESFYIGRINPCFTFSTTYNIQEEVGSSKVRNKLNQLYFYLRI